VAEASPSPELPITPGQVIAERYLVGDVLGGGGMGVVCAGTHVLLGTPVAIKLIHSELKDSAEAVQRFMNEARAAAALKGEHIARVFDVGVLSSGEPYLVMEQLEGVSLDQYLLERGPLGQTEAVDIVLQACEGLAEAHGAGLVHRDIKPANLFLAKLATGQYSLKILDFGIAKQRIEQNTPALTNPGKSLGSPWYMSPEQMLTPASVDERADVWSLGVLLFELLTGKRPFDGETVPQVCATVLTAPTPKLSDYREGLSPELEPIILCCLEKEPERRFASVVELTSALLRFASAPTHGSGLALDDSEAPGEQLSEERRKTPSYGSLTPLATGSGWPTAQRSLPRAAVVALVALPLLLLGGWLAFRQGAFASRAAARGIELPWEPQLQITRAPESELERTIDPPSLLQALHGARAAAEPERAPAPAVVATEVDALTAAQSAARAAAYDAWLRSQGLKRIPQADAAPTPPVQPEPEAPPVEEQVEPPSPPADLQTPPEYSDPTPASPEPKPDTGF